MPRTLVLAWALLVLGLEPTAQSSQAPQTGPMNDLAERYVKLVLALGEHDADYVDAYYGPADWKTEAARARIPLSAIESGAEIDRQAAIAWLARFAMMSPARAEQRTRFFDQYRSYVINYNLGKDLVKHYVESQAGGDPAKRWDAFVRLLASPRLPSGLR